MGGQSSQKTTQSSTTAPWLAAQPALQGILGQLSDNLGNTGLTGAESGAIDTLQRNAGQASQFAPQIQSFARDLLGGGGAMDQAGNVNANLQRFTDQTNPIASNMNFNPYETPGFRDAIDTITSDITNQTNGAFAAGGRDFSGAHSKALARGIMQGVAPTIASQFNTNRAAQQGAAGNLFNAGNTSAGILSGLNQTRLGNQAQGVTAAGQATDAANAGANQILAAEAARRGIPVQALGLLTQIGVPIAGLGGQSTGQSETTHKMSPVQQFMGIMGGINSMFGRR